MFRVKSVAKYVAFSSCGKDFFVHVVGIDCVLNQGFESTRYYWLKAGPKNLQKIVLNQSFNNNKEGVSWESMTQAQLL